MEEIGGQMVIRLEQDAAHGKVLALVHMPLSLWTPLLLGYR